MNEAKHVSLKLQLINVRNNTKLINSSNKDSVKSETCVKSEVLCYALQMW